MVCSSTTASLFEFFFFFFFGFGSNFLVLDPMAVDRFRWYSPVAITSIDRRMVFKIVCLFDWHR